MPIRIIPTNSIMTILVYWLKCTCWCQSRVKRLPELPRDGAFRIVTVATQVAEVDATAQHKDRDEQRSKKLPLWLTEAGYLFQDVINYGHKPFTGSSGSGMRSPHLTSSRLRLFTPFAQKCPKCCIGHDLES